MKMRIASLALVVFMTAFAMVGRSFAGNIVIYVDEGDKTRANPQGFGLGSYTIDGKNLTKIQGAKATDPVNGNMNGFAYTLPVTVTNGDLILSSPPTPSEPTPIISDVIRFQAKQLFFYSDFHVGEGILGTPSADLTGGTVPMAVGVKDPVTNQFVFPVPNRAVAGQLEGNDDANNGATYQPKATDPGGDPNNTIVYRIKSEGTGGPDLREEPVKSMIDKKKSIDFNASQRTLTVTDDHVIDTGFFDDPLLNAAVNVPIFSLVGSSAGGNFLFVSQPDSVFSLSSGSTVFMAAQLPILIYSPTDNTFSGMLTNLSFNTDSGSIWVDDTINFLNPDWPLFDPGVQFLFTMQPDANMRDLTESFSIDGSAGGSNGIVAVSVSVPAPSTFLLLLAGFSIFYWRGAQLARGTRAERRKTVGRSNRSTSCEAEYRLGRPAERQGFARILGFVLASLCGAGVFLSPMPAASTTIDDLLKGEKIVIGDKSFENWRTYQSLGGGGALPVPAAEITVSPLFDPEDPLFVGLEYSTDKWAAEQNETQTTTWTYDVRTRSGAKLIKDNELRIGAAGLENSGTIRITELAVDATDDVIATKTAFFSTTLDEGVATATFAPQNFLKITTTVILNGGPLVNGHAGLQSFTQRFSQIPAPSSLWLLGIGLTGLLIARRFVSRVA